MDKPTCDQLFEEDGFESVHRESDDSWRHGSYVFEVFRRASDGTFWGASYRLSSDGETNELREGLADVFAVEPIQETKTVYRKRP